jgi:hypothetical protein
MISHVLFGLVVEVASVQECLRRDTTNVQARSTKTTTFFNARNLIAVSWTFHETTFMPNWAALMAAT